MNNGRTSGLDAVGSASWERRFPASCGRTARFSGRVHCRRRQPIMQGMADSGRSSRMMNLARATDLKVDVMDVMRQTADHCQKLKETASIAVKVRQQGGLTMYSMRINAQANTHPRTCAYTRTYATIYTNTRIHTHTRMQSRHTQTWR